MEIIGALPKTDSGNRFLPVITDRYTKLTNTIPLVNQTAFDTDDEFLIHWLYKFGIPDSLLTYNGSNFNSTILVAICCGIQIQAGLNSFSITGDLRSLLFFMQLMSFGCYVIEAGFTKV